MGSWRYSRMGIPIAALALVPARAAEPMPPVLQLYSYQVADQALFEDGYRRHLGWHAAHGDKLVWYAWTVDSGRRKGLFVDGTAGASYAGLDARPDPAGDGADAVRTFLPHVHAVNVETWELWRTPSTGTPLEDRAPGATMDVFVMRVPMRDAATFERAVEHVAAGQSGDSPSLTWYRAVRGGALPSYMLILSRPNWAELERTGSSLRALLSRAYGAQSAEIEPILRTLSDVEVESWSYQPRLSLIPGRALAP
jgi:hypothetical protein